MTTGNRAGWEDLQPHIPIKSSVAAQRRDDGGISEIKAL
jgi:hypothetical protein